MKADWVDDMDKESCLCCGQRVKAPIWIRSPEQAAALLAILEGIGFTREMLLTDHRAQLEYQHPGFAEWLQAQ